MCHSARSSVQFRHCIVRALYRVPVLIAIDQWNAFFYPGVVQMQHGSPRVEYDPNDAKDPNGAINRIAFLFRGFGSFRLVSE